MNTSIFWSPKKITWFATAGLLLAACLLFGSAKPLHADNERVITIYHDGTQQTIVTDAPTVAEALKRTDIRLDEHDAVEPDRSTKLTAPAYDINIYRARPVTVMDGANRYQVISPHTSARQIAADAGVKLYDEDGYSLTRIDDFVAEDGVGLKLTIKRSVPLHLLLFGKAVDARTLAGTVGDFLKEKHITVPADGRVYPAIDTPINEGMTVAVYTDGSMDITEEAVPFTVTKIQDADRAVGYKEVRTPGVAGRRFVMYQLVGGVRKEVQSYLLVQPKEQVEVVGTKTATSTAGDLSAALSLLRSCEARANGYATNTGNSFYGAYQFTLSTWKAHAPDGWKDALPSDAPGSVQDAAAIHLYNARGWQPWPACSKKLGLQDIYR